MQALVGGSFAIYNDYGWERAVTTDYAKALDPTTPHRIYLVTDASKVG